MLNVSHPALNVHRLHRHQHRESRMHRSNPMQKLVELTSIQIQAFAATTDTAQLRTTSTAITSASLETPNSTRRLNGKNTQSTSRINRTFCFLVSRSRTSSPTLYRFVQHSISMVDRSHAYEGDGLHLGEVVIHTNMSSRPSHMQPVPEN